MQASPQQPPARASYGTRVLSIALDSALVVAAIEVLGLLVRIPGTRTVPLALLLGVASFGAGAMATLPAAALAALSFPSQRRARRLGGLWWLLSAIVAGIAAHSQRTILLGLATDYGWMRATGLVGLLFVVLGLPASFLLREVERRVLAWGLAALLVVLMAGGLALGLEVFIRMQPWLHAFLGFGVAACVVLLRVLLRDARRPPWLAGVALAGGAALMLPAITANHVVYAHAAHRALLLSDALHLVHPIVKPLPAVPAAQVRASPDGPRPLPTPPRLVLLVTIDSLRYDITQSPALPTFSALRARSVEFTQARTTAGFTIAAMYSLMTGRGSWRIEWKPMHFLAGTVPKTVPVPVMDRTPTLAAALRARGYRTATCGVMLAQSRGWGLSEGFEQLDLSIFEARNRDARGTTADVVKSCALRMIEEARGAALFLWLHYYDPHGPYSVHPGIEVDEDDAADRYRGEVLFVDRHLGELVREVEQQVSRDDLMLVVASDHGEEFGEHGAAAHVYALYEETLRVPLLIAAPGLTPRRVDAPVSLADVAPTVVELLGAAPLADTDGISLAGALRGQPLPARPQLAETVRLGRSLRAIVDGTYKLIHDSRFDTYELFDLTHDPGEQWSLTDALPDVAARLARAMGVPPPR